MAAVVLLPVCREGRLALGVAVVTGERSWRPLGTDIKMDSRPVSFVWTDENENLEEYETKIIFYLNILDDNNTKAFSL